MRVRRAAVHALLVTTLLAACAQQAAVDAAAPPPLSADEKEVLVAEVIAALETVLERSPEHPLALHLYIHTVEASSSPGHAEQAADLPPIESFRTIPLLALVQFGRWEEIVAEPQPREDLDYSNAIWRYARAAALARTGDPATATEERAGLIALMKTDKVLRIDGSDCPAVTLLQSADHLVQGEIARAGGDIESAIDDFAIAVATQDELPYLEPPFWYHPTRQSLGEAAEAVYRRDLEDYPRNGWSLFGLLQSFEGRGKKQEAAAVRERFERAWQLADVELTGSRL